MSTAEMKMKLLLKLMKPIIATLFLILVPSLASAQLAKVAGIVVDPQPARITQAKVTVAGEHDRRELTTDEEGFFQGSLQPGWYEITVSHEGFQTRKFKLFLTSDVVTPLNVTLNVWTSKCPKGQIC